MYLFNDACLFSRAITCPLREYPPINKTILSEETNDSGLEFANSAKKKNDYDLKTYYVGEMLR